MIKLSNEEAKISYAVKDQVLTVTRNVPYVTIANGLMIPYHEFVRELAQHRIISDKVFRKALNFNFLKAYDFAVKYEAEFELISPVYQK